MVYLALLRGINVGVNRRVEMKRLKATFERLGFERVRTYINSGNVLFVTGDHTDRASLCTTIEAGIEEDFGFPVTVLVRDAHTMGDLAAALPEDWRNDADAKCDVMFLSEEYDSPEILERLTIKPGIDDVRYVRGAILWHVPRSVVTKSGMFRLVGTPLYMAMTVRNCNTARKLAAMMEDG